MAPAEPDASPSSAACADWHETAQVARFDGRLFDARAALRSCAQESCPTIVRGDCVRWLEEVQRQIPTVVFEAVGDEGTLTDVEVRSGNRLLVSQLGGAAVEVPPGPAEFVFTRPSGEQAVVRVFVRPGEVNRVVSADLRRHPEPTSTAAAPPLEEGKSKGTRPVPPVVYWTGAGALVGVVVGVTFGTIAKVKEAEAAGSCAPNCSDAVVSNITSHALVADVAFGVALAAGVTSFVLFVTRPTVKVPSTPAARTDTDAALRFRPVAAATPHAGWVGVRGSFR